MELNSGIEVDAHGGIICTGDGIKTYAHLTIYSGLCLEAGSGLKLSRGYSALQAAKREFGVKGNTISVLQQLGLRFIDHGLIERQRHEKELQRLMDRGKITAEQHAKFVAAIPTPR
jgi:hypothetical protein